MRRPLFPNDALASLLEAEPVPEGSPEFDELGYPLEPALDPAKFDALGYPLEGEEEP